MLKGRRLPASFAGPGATTWCIAQQPLWRAYKNLSWSTLTKHSTLPYWRLCYSKCWQTGVLGVNATYTTPPYRNPPPARSVPLLTLMRHADSDGQDWSPLVAEVLSYMDWAELGAADSKKGEPRLRGCVWMLQTWAV